MKITTATACSIVLAVLSAHALAAPVLQKSVRDDRIRLAAYSADQVYPLYGYVGYQIDLQFEPGEAFVGLAAGDIEGIGFVAQDNHLFLKPKAPKVGTNVTVITNRRQYQFDYAAIARRPDREVDDVVYVVRFTYPPPAAPVHAVDSAAQAARALAQGEAARPKNIDYWFCGDPAVKPIAASDDGVHTRLTFDARSELPALFVRNDDGSESLLNFSMQDGDVILHRVARRFILRRGKLTGCIVNAGFSGSGVRLDSHTVSPAVGRETRKLKSEAESSSTGGVP